ncbi:hypothetical protein ABT093_26055 [Kitasatospora sp. NPDC002551]|uniref:hypothetical protein n=1 Tax=Kitasatospora sp. NPDC002551 TaxID=3154539 RepID=UPI0033219FAB
MDEATTEHRPVGDRVDEALSGRGFTTRALRLRAAGVLLAITAGVSGVLLYNLTNVFGPDSVCGGAASADAVHAALGPGRISEEKSAGYVPTAVDPAQYCRATVDFGLFGDTGQSVSFGLSVTRSAGAESRPAARLFAEGGAVGAVTPGGAWALLPEGCPTGLRASVGTGHDGKDGDHAEGIARLAVGLAGLAAKDRDCGGAPPAPRTLSPVGAEQPVDWGNLCGLPGMAVTRAPDADHEERYRQQATTAFSPFWSCEVTDSASGTPVASFAVVTEPRLVDLPADKERSTAFGRSTWTGSSNEDVVTTCQGRRTYFHYSWRSAPALRDRVLLPDTTAVWTQFLTAAGKAIGCEPILP